MKKKIAGFLLFVLLAVCAAPAFAAETESAYDRVLRTKTIRCGYLPYEPYISKDPVTGKLSGVTYDYLNAVAKRDSLRVDWVGEVNIDQLVPALDAGKFDAFCMPCTPDQNWARVAEFTGYLGAVPYFVYVPENSTLTEETLSAAKFTVVDGFALTDITKRAFPEAPTYSLPQTASTAEMYDQLRYGKADAHVNEHISAMNYMRNNPGVIRRFSDKPLIAMRMFLVSKKGDEEMRDFLGAAFDADKPDNLALMKELLKKNDVPSGALLLGKECRADNTPDGWAVCAPPEHEKTEPTGKSE